MDDLHLIRLSQLLTFPIDPALFLDLSPAIRSLILKLARSPRLLLRMRLADRRSVHNATHTAATATANVPAAVAQAAQSETVTKLKPMGPRPHTGLPRHNPRRNSGA